MRLLLALLLLTCAAECAFFKPAPAVRRVRAFPAARTGKAAAKQALTAAEKRELQLKRRKAGIKALKAAAALAKERARRRRAEELQQVPRSRPLERDPVESPPSLFATLVNLAVARAQLSMLRQQEQIRALARALRIPGRQEG